ncbi:MAG TPA: pyridoxamine 5'-phosphate oxidase family protein [Pyrinomonadaceae bacterium]|jgi:nitroimidazol reductase NimA-like FMN-containing flavoprotein (pyridoxamine 5'-phosphate oxidase superfamily)|nr:pyridoxamine 5'-phosphate oxidase family protein [Pyrinomonadaceae bacterium]
MRDVEADGASGFRRTERTTLRRLPKRGSFERQTVYDILDEGFVCHVGFVSDGHPVVIPTAYGRAGDKLYLHGARASRMLKALGAGADVCVSVTLVDGLVLARSAFHHSINYRSVVVFGRARVVESDEEKTAALLAFTEHVVPGRWGEVREPTKQELDSTLVLSLTLEEASAKVRTGPPVDDEEDYELPIWAGVLPLRVAAGEAIPDTRLKEGTPPPRWLADFDPARRHE